MTEEYAPVCVVGLGRIGLPLAVQCASRGLSVIGCDIDEALVERIDRGECPYPDEEGLAEGLAAAHKGGLLRATTDTATAVAGCRIVSLVVPVGLSADKQPDFSALDAAAADVARGLRPGTLVILETTVPLGTTRQRLLPLLEASGQRLGENLFLAHSPERVFVGRVLTDLRRYPKIVGGVDDASGERAAAFYERALDTRVMRVGGAEAAELVKLAETTYRDVNIAFANELAEIAAAYGVDVTEVIEGANSQPYSHIHQPGVGVGGHCIPVYPHFLLAGAPKARFPRQGRETNDGMSAYAVERLAEALGGLSGKRVLILGLSYRADIKEAAYSSALLLASELKARGAVVRVHDPNFAGEEIDAYGLEAEPSLPAPCDAAILQAPHQAYRDLDFSTLPGCTVVLDGRNAIARERVESRGLRYIGIGR